jgi:hypothetical protein
MTTTSALSAFRTQLDLNNDSSPQDLMQSITGYLEGDQEYKHLYVAGKAFGSNLYTEQLCKNLHAVANLEDETLRTMIKAVGGKEAWLGTLRKVLAGLGDQQAEVTPRGKLAVVGNSKRRGRGGDLGRRFTHEDGPLGAWLKRDGKLNLIVLPMAHLLKFITRTTKDKSGKPIGPLHRDDIGDIAGALWLWTIDQWPNVTSCVELFRYYKKLLDATGWILPANKDWKNVLRNLWAAMRASDAIVRPPSSLHPSTTLPLLAHPPSARRRSTRSATRSLASTTRSRTTRRGCRRSCRTACAARSGTAPSSRPTGRSSPGRCRSRSRRGPTCAA